MSAPQGEASLSSPAPAAAPPPGKSTGPARRRRWVTIALVVALAAAIAAVWIDAHNRDRQLREEVAQRLAELDASDKVLRATVLAAQDSLRDAQAKIALLENRLAESQTQQAALDALYRELAPSRDEWALTEVEQVLLLASQQLQLAANVSAALAALQLADAKLQRLNRPQFVPLRRALARDMDRLKAVPYVDVPGISLRLDQAIAGVDALPLALEERLPPPQEIAPKDEPGWRRFLRDAWQDLRQLVRIENLDRPEAPLLTPPQQFFLRENLKLRLLSARFDLLFRDQANFRADLAAADVWLKKYFDTRAKPVQSLQTLLKELRATDMATELPGLAGSLDAVRVLQLAREKHMR
ncbi:MAG TPA: uroporphyrinogen-III C-methyltransferase [Casimicrobiaceae bacterium]|nr:uroporphyrinogen-III C-methyltransferase [Casimicrobiaceae bacterium]